MRPHCAQRGLEARIGRLIGGAKLCDNQHSVTTEISDIAKDDRHDFRIPARAIDGHCNHTLDDWRQSRRALLYLFVAVADGRGPKLVQLNPLPLEIFIAISS